MRHTNHTTYDISYKRSGVYQSIIVKAHSLEVAQKYFRVRIPNAEVLGARQAQAGDMKPGKPVMVVTEARWKGAGFGDYRCSLCDEETSGTPDFCPHCHAYMG